MSDFHARLRFLTIVVSGVKKLFAAADALLWISDHG